MSLCLAAAGLAATLAANAFTLAWTHSIEKIRWEEDWQVAGGRLHLVAARVRGSGAGMEIPADAELRDGVWHYRPALAALPRLELAHSPYVAAYRICIAGDCRTLPEIVGALPATATVTLSACAE